MADFFAGLDYEEVVFSGNVAQMKKITQPLGHLHYEFSMPKIYSDNGAYFRRIPTQFYKKGSNGRDAATIVGFFAVLHEDCTYVAVCHSIVGLNAPSNRTLGGRAREPKGTFMVLDEKALGFLLASHRILQHSKAAVDMGWVRFDCENPDNVFDQHFGWRAGEDIPRSINIPIAADSAANGQSVFHICKAKGKGDEGRVNIFCFEGLRAYADRAQIEDAKLDGEVRVAEVVDRVWKQR